MFLSGAWKPAGESNIKGRSQTGYGVDSDAAAMFLDGLVGDKQSQPGAFAALGGEEHGEHIFVTVHRVAKSDALQTTYL